MTTKRRTPAEQGYKPVSSRAVLSAILSELSDDDQWTWSDKSWRQNYLHIAHATRHLQAFDDLSRGHSGRGHSFLVLLIEYIWWWLIELPVEIDERAIRMIIINLLNGMRKGATDWKRFHQMHKRATDHGWWYADAIIDLIPPLPIGQKAQ